MPNQPKTPIRGVRVPEDLWQAFRQATAARGETPSEVLRACILSYVRLHAGWPPAQASDRDEG